MGTQRAFTYSAFEQIADYPGRQGKRTFFPYQGANAAPITPTLTFSSTPSGSSITIDSVLIGVAPIATVVTSADHTIDIVTIIPPVICPTLIVSQGYTTGGATFSLLGTGITVLELADLFAGVSLDGAKWTNVSAGGGVAVNNSLRLSVPTTGGTAAVRSINTWDAFDVTTAFSYDKSLANLHPTAELIFFKLDARIDATNRFSVEHAWDPTLGEVLRTSVTTAGVTSVLTTDSVESSSGQLRLVRYGGRVIVYAGAHVLVDFKGWRTDTVTFQMSTSCASAPTSLLTTITEFMPRVLVTFGEEIGPTTDEVIGRLVGSIPATILPGLIEVVAHGNSSTQSAGLTFEYVNPLQLTLGTGISVSDDDTLRDTSKTLKGFRI